MIDTVTSSSIRNQLLDRRNRLRRASEEVGEAGDLVHLLREVDTALSRLDGDAYGDCEVCGDFVGERLLGSHPLTPYCLCDLTPERLRAIEQDLGLARRIQTGLLPPQDIAHAGWLSHFRFIPHGPVSGDYLDVVIENEEKICFLLGDVSGKGVAASFLMAHLSALFRSLLETGLPLPRVVEQANRIFARSTISTHYATLVAGCADRNGVVEICNAGHFPPLLVRRDSVVPVDPTGFPVGIFGESPYKVHRLQVAPEDSLFLFTDGLTESRNPEGEEYGDGRLTEVLRRGHRLSPGKMAASALIDLERFQGERSPEDDLTLLVLRRTG